VRWRSGWRKGDKRVGQECDCTVEFGGRTFAGKALLETSELIFRGETRLKIPFKDIRGIQASDGRLLIAFPEGRAAFHLGDRAAKWAHKILHPPSRMDKLGVKEGARLRWIGAPDAWFRLEAEERGAVFVRSNPDMTFVCASNARELAEIDRLPPGPLWVVYPKGKAELREIDVLNAGRAAGLVDIKVASFSSTQTALKFVGKKKDKNERMRE
jgi:hypothetical protein